MTLNRLTHLCRVNKELRSRFNHFLETGDDSKVPVALQADIFTAVRWHFMALRGFPH